MTGTHAVPNNLPAPLTSFVGREREIAEVCRLLRGTRLLTLTGAGGCGKSRLALEATSRVLEDFPDGVWVVELAALSEASFVPRTVAAVLSVPEQTGRVLPDTLTDALRLKSLLLVLDNAEHLLAGCAGLTDILLRGCGRLRIITTSREALGVAGEAIWRVPPLSAPDPAHLPPRDRVMEFEAVRLFSERAAAVRSDFQVTDDNASAVAQVCHRLDGIPLAIELAAARVRALSVDQIAGRLRDRFELLTAGNRTALPHHRTLRAAMDWSYDLLTEREQRLLARLSVFTGGWPLEAAEAVCAGDGIDAPEILNLLASLVDKSLVLAEIQGREARYRLLETMRQYARTRLEEVDDARALRRRHRDWYLGLAERAAPQMWCAVQTTWLRRLEPEHDNFRAALDWCETDEEGVDAGLRLSAALLWYWFIHGDIKEGREYLEAALTRGPAAPAHLRARALCGAAILAWRHDEYDHAFPLLAESVALFRALGDVREIAFALHFMAHLAEARGQFSEAVDQFEESLAYYRRTNDVWGIGKSLSCLGSALLHQGEYARAESLIEEGLPLLRRAGDQTHSASALARLACLAQRRGDVGRAKARLDEGLRMVRGMEPTHYTFGALITLGLVAVRSGDWVSGSSLLREGLAAAWRVEDRENTARSLEGLAEAATVARRPATAARLTGAAEAIREAIGHPLSPGQRPGYEDRIAALRDVLDETGLAEARATGAAMTPHEAVEYALTALDPEASNGAPVAFIKGRSAALTTREREVAGLIAQGLTNREIAARLVIAERTAEGHVQSILNKLTFNSRAQIAAWAVEHGLRVPSA